jgi:subtilisin family serine protease
MAARQQEPRDSEAHKIASLQRERASCREEQPTARVDPLDLVRLTELMSYSTGRPEIRIGLIDGPVALDHTELTAEHIESAPNADDYACASGSGAACGHGTFVAGILLGRRGSPAPSLCPDCTLLLRPIFSERGSEVGQPPSATPAGLAEAVHDCVEAGVRVLNISSALLRPLPGPDRMLQDAFHYAMHRGVLVVAAAGNQGSLGSTAITGHPWVIPVTACDRHGRPLLYANLGHSIGRNGLSAPGDNITSLSPEGTSVVASGSSVAAPLVTGTIALLWSEFPTATAAHIRLAMARAHSKRRTSVVPPLLDAMVAFRALAAITSQKMYA